MFSRQKQSRKPADSEDDLKRESAREDFDYKDKESSTDIFLQTILWTITNATFSSRSSSVNQLHSPYLYNLFYASLPLKNELSGYTSIINYMVSYFLGGNL